MSKVTREDGLPTASTMQPLDAIPTRRVSGRWISFFALSWFGVWIAQLTPVQLLLPLQVQKFLDATDWVQNVLGFGYISGIAGVFAFVAYPLTGALSDRTTSRYGRRRPWIAVGTAGFALSLVFLGLQGTLLGIGIFWVASSTFFCVLTAALTAAISDQVPVSQRGYVSGWISAPQAIGIIAGLVLVTALGLSTFAGYALLAGLLVVLGLPFLLLIDDEVLPPGVVPALSWRSLLGGLWISPRKFPDFGWTLLSRILVNLGNAFGTSLLLYFLMYGLKVSDAKGSLILLTLVYMVFVIIASLWLGRLSDRYGRRRAFVFGASVLQAIAALILAFVPTLGAATVAAALLGLGYGCFLSVDQALATEVLPDQLSRGKDLGIMNIALSVPQAFAPMLGALLVSATGGFTLLFLVSGLTALAGAAAVSRVKGVR
ncbi:MFS transporter [Arthrobacter antibioticus]|uniref:MFS transporter n=1 Tax=Arthrobacter sp. H35-MC1 TaxID=3046203 RepID=UPI0024BA43E1|nr:MFS transporter [Arthrobacter sp. H35-MC1]MDJ0317035.1 MFS transporter [Arthrobacter sp. H35-MC1]